MPFKNIRTPRPLCFTGGTMITEVIPVSMMGRAKIIRTILAIRTTRTIRGGDYQDYQDYKDHSEY